MESATYSEARVEYHKQMATKLVGPLLEFFRQLRAELWAESQQGILSRFQRKCAEIPKWNQDVVADETNKLIEISHCDYLEELMTALFIAHTKVMASVRIHKKNKKLTITVPKLDHFLHRVFTECAKSFWKAPFLFSEELVAIERQKNLLQAERVIEDSIYGAVREMLPIKKILQEYISEPDDEERESVDTAPVSSPESIIETKSAVVTMKTPELIVKEEPIVIDEPIVLEAPIVQKEPVVQKEQVVQKEPIVQKELVVQKEKEEEPEVNYSNIKIDTEPSVQFSEMVSVFDERTPHVSEMRSIANPMMRHSSEEDDKDRERDRESDKESELLHIGQEVGGLDIDEVEELDSDNGDNGDNGGNGDNGIGDFETLE